MVTAHRRENWGEGIDNICKAINRIIEENEDAEVVYLVHLNPIVKDVVYRELEERKNTSFTAIRYKGNP